ncbi:replication stress response regulator SDE2 [Abrus precatorius]|uniref:Replication stress response regulator SDE2 n=1 Tax=Abrus precatorius TaxID=3816 RepID=A0A8B8L3P6_ABRPR|nr:replication stress response regulator SDE2 [Abrus precatorius]
MEQNKGNKMYNLFVKHLDGKTLTLTFPSPILHANSIKDRLFELTGIPIQHQRLVTGCRHLNDEKSVIQCSPEDGNIFPSVRLLLRLKGGKGGFGSLLRGAATKAGQKKTNNFDACRDMSGRRLRHVNAEKRLEEWKAGEEERRLEKVAEDFLKKQMKKGKKGVGDGEAHKYVAKYREESERCVAEVALSVKEALSCKRKSPSQSSLPHDAKKFKIWMGKRKLNESDSDYSDDDDDGETEKSVLLSGQNESESNKAEGSLGSVTGGKRDGDSSGAGSCESGSEEEKETVGLQSSESVVAEPVINDEIMEATALPCLESVLSGINAEDNGNQDCDGGVADKFVGAVSQASNVTISETVVDASKSNDMEIDGSLEHKAAVHEESSPSTSIPALEEPLNFDAFNSAAELEVLGLETLKSELQSRGLKCGGTLQERAARLFLLKSTPLNKLPKKLLAKK